MTPNESALMDMIDDKDRQIYDLWALLAAIYESGNLEPDEQAQLEDLVAEYDGKL